MLLAAAVLGEVSIRAAGHEARLPLNHMRGGATDDLRGGHSHGSGNHPPCRIRQRKLVFIGAPFCEGQNLAGTDLVG